MELKDILATFSPMLRDIDNRVIADFSAHNPLKLSSRINHRPAYATVSLERTGILKDLKKIFELAPYHTIFSDAASRKTILRVFRQTRLPKPLLQELDQIKHLNFLTYRHILSVSALIVKISLDVPQLRLDPLHAACLGLAHDLGKSRIPESILGKTGPLTREEFHIIQTHPVIEYHLASSYFIHQNTRIATMTFTHHERLDGSGYPRGIRNVNAYVQAIIPCDIFDALTAERPYRSSPYTPRSALNLLWEESLHHKMNHVFVLCLVCYMRRQKPRFNDVHISLEQRDTLPLVNYYGMHLP